jgi:pSer/pThr/pTyr-binding forkhead associated (FHA) protein/tetratricopeptide (TPR) repeat protein
MFKLVIQDDEGKTTVVPLIRDEITIGRKEGNTIRLTERNVSRRHARILRNNGEVQIEDLGSYNGIRVNNARIAERVSLRVSDQVQIGDYKLYLKAEGVEQVDDARTMPIERIDAPATEVMPAVQAPATQPMQAQPIPQPPPPNRSAAATADTDPSGRPVATAAQVAALTQPVGYGKLVVISSNFAGKEFELNLPQMIIGRTEDNNLVINHRSISRNHAKIVRDPETGRYTISDLHSSNGVRVNGQDYTKVELRRGDVVDLGHVRLRFVEPGEDWIFSRDAVIADVPESGGGKNGMWIALLVLLVAGGTAAFFILNKKDTSAGKSEGSGSNVEVVGTQPGSGSAENGGSGEASGVAMVQTPDAAVVSPDDEGGRIKVECLQDITDKKWTDATSCAERLAQYDAPKAKELKTKAAQEMANEITVGKLDQAIRDQDFTQATRYLKDIEADSVYRKDSQQKVDDLKNKLVGELKQRAEAANRAKRCDDVDKLISQARQSYGAAVADELAQYKCTVVATNPGGNDHPGGDHGSHSGSATNTPPPPASCDGQELMDKGSSYIGAGQYAAAIAALKQASTCKGANMAQITKLGFLASCKAKDVDNARRFWKRLTSNEQTGYVAICVGQGITRDQLDK